MAEQGEELQRAITARRNCGDVTCAAESNERLVDPYDLANAIVVAQGFRALGHKWRMVEKDKALNIVTSLLHRDLAYDHPVMPEREAREFAARFLELVRNPRAYFTNGTWTEPSVVFSNGVERLGSWDAITDATFDAGIICIGATETAILWVEDED